MNYNWKNKTTDGFGEVKLKFLFVLLGPRNDNIDYFEIGRCIGTLMTNRDFRDCAYRAQDRRELIEGITSFMNRSLCMVVPVGDFDTDLMQPVTEWMQTKIKTKTLTLSSSGNKKHSDPKLYDRCLTPAVSKSRLNNNSNLRKNSQCSKFLNKTLDLNASNNSNLLSVLVSVTGGGLGNSNGLSPGGFTNLNTNINNNNKNNSINDNKQGDGYETGGEGEGYVQTDHNLNNQDEDDEEEDEEEEGEDPIYNHEFDPFQKTGRVFGNMIREIKYRFSFFWSDFTDALNLHCFIAFIFIFTVCLASALSFGGILADKTNKWFGVNEMLIATSMNGIISGLISAQPIMILGPTGPFLVFEG
jgi:hypothetical protein